jgi:hypothetical protein
MTTTKIHKVARVSLGVVMLIACLQCTKRNEEDLKSICFESEILPIIQANCATIGCHNSTTAADGYDLSTYEGIMRAVKPGNGRNSKIVKVMLEDKEEKRMPPPPAAPMSSQFIELVIQWIDKGAGHVVGCSLEVGCDTSSVSFSADITPVLNDFCVSCHNASAPSGGVVLSTYNGVKSVADDGRLVGSVFHLPGFSPMPPSGTRLDECKLNKIKAWGNAGAPAN